MCDTHVRNRDEHADVFGMKSKRELSEERWDSPAPASPSPVLVQARRDSLNQPDVEDGPRELHSQQGSRVVLSQGDPTYFRICAY